MKCMFFDKREKRCDVWPFPKKQCKNYFRCGLFDKK